MSTINQIDEAVGMVAKQRLRPRLGELISDELHSKSYLLIQETKVTIARTRMLIGESRRLTLQSDKIAKECVQLVNKETMDLIKNKYNDK